jgi:hypothetical protein
MRPSKPPPTNRAASGVEQFLCHGLRAASGSSCSYFSQRLPNIWRFDRNLIVLVKIDLFSPTERVLFRARHVTTIMRMKERNANAIL